MRLIEERIAWEEGRLDKPRIMIRNDGTSGEITCRQDNKSRKADFRIRGQKEESILKPPLGLRIAVYLGLLPSIAVTR